jgi:hypothetical protein
MANNFKIKAAELVEVQVPAGNSKQVIYFPDLPNLRNKQVEGIEVFSNLELTTSISGQVVQDTTSLRNAVVTLYFKGGEYIVTPLEAIRRVVNRTQTSYFGDIPSLAGQVIDWTKCYVTLNADVVGFSGKSFVFNVYYIL